MKFLKGTKFHKALNIFIIVGWLFIFADSTYRVIAGPRTHLWIDIFFIVLATIFTPFYVIDYRKKFSKKK
ncbi:MULTISPECIES: hypothetical protein [Bacillus]|uniref:hypothetical protein n=1 Tax=Bacillus TaxID=1386 RepID=UPI000BF64332|nr:MULTISPECIES: hypothetical protein [Bacillus]MBG0967585.1 hypothetical protein [Bacillus sp. SRB3LM]PFB64400.1 hypothetical protein CN291_17095 [Bacillus cereus]